MYILRAHIIIGATQKAIFSYIFHSQASGNGASLNLWIKKASPSDPSNQTAREVFPQTGDFKLFGV